MVVGEIPTQVHCYLVKHAADRLSHTNNVDTTKTITHVSLCAGYGGIDLGLGRAIPNLRTIAFSEIEAFACANLVSKMEAGLLDAAPIWTNLKTFPWEEFRDKVDILSGGYPCQPFSAAGKRLGRDDPRHLWPWIADGIRTMRPRICFFENVEGHISLGLREVISELESIGYKATWGIFSAREVGAPHQRKRVFILAERSSERGSARFSRQIAWQEGVARIVDDCGHQAWPSRPGQPQHGWEPPRVVGNAIYNGSHQCSKESRGEIASGKQGRMQESERGSSSMGDTEHDGSLGLPECRGSHQDSNWCKEGSINAIEFERAGGSADCGHLPENQGGVMGNSESIRSSTRRTEHEGLGGQLCTTSTGSEGAMGNSEGWQDHGRESRDLAEESRCGTGGDHAADCTGEVLADTSIVRCDGRPNGISGRIWEPGEVSEDTAGSGGQGNGMRQTQPSLGRDSDGATDWLGHAELYVTSDNRTDELRLLGNGVVPATATRAFLVLMDQLLNQ